VTNKGEVKATTLDSAATVANDQPICRPINVYPACTTTPRETLNPNTAAVQVSKETNNLRTAEFFQGQERAKNEYSLRSRTFVSQSLSFDLLSKDLVVLENLVRLGGRSAMVC
jgi:hypothetical protein